MSQRRVRPVERGHLLAAFVVIITSLCCDAAPDAAADTAGSSNRNGEPQLLKCQ